MSLIIGVLGRPGKTERDIIVYSKAVMDVIIRYDAIPLGIIPPKLDITEELDAKEKEKIFRMIDLCDGIILQGGKSYYPYDMVAIKYINEKDIPVLGICLGMQSLGAATGGRLGNVSNHRVPDQNYVHDVIVDKNSRFYMIVQQELLNVNSRHEEQLIDYGTYNVVGYSLDNVIEIIEDPKKRFNIGVQWHPEDLVDFDEVTKRLFDAFFEECSKK
jgi:gamma-glutamyl-gamma-aminobutyrate hydrolase PuuD